MIRRDLLGYVAILVFLSFFMSGCTRYYNPTGTNYSKKNRYYNPSPQTKTTSGLSNTNRFSTTSNNNGYRDDYNNYNKSVNNTNYRGRNRDSRDKTRYTNRDYNRYNQVLNNTNNIKPRDKNRYSNSNDNSEYGNRRKTRTKTRHNENNIVGTYSRPAVVHENFTNDPRYEYHMDKRRFFYKPRPKVPYYYRDGIYYYGGSYNSGAYEYRGSTLTGGEYHGDR